jgi:hypothetical protein
MKNIYILGHKRAKPSYFLFGFASLIVLALAISAVVIANAGDQLDIAGYLDFSYGTVVRDEPTAEKPESKLWWNDGFWWGILYNDAASEYHIYYLDWGEQNWVDTGTAVDDREDSKSDALWDDNAKKLYVASHFWKSSPSHTSLENERARVYRYSYDQVTQTYTQDSGFPKIVNEDKTETLVLDKDSTGRLWVTFVGHDPDPSINPLRYTVQVNSATDDGATWGTQMRVPVPGFENDVHVDDISSLIAFTDDEGSKIGVMWSNQLDDNFYFATHDDNADPANGWTLETVDFSPYEVLSDDHINLAKSAGGQVFAAIKTGNTVDGDPQVGIIARDTDGSYSFHVFSDVGSNDTRPIVVVNSDENKVYLFVTSNPIGGRICYKTAVITAPLSNMAFSPGNCLDSGEGGTAAEFAIADSGYDSMNNVTSTKQNVDDTTGLVVMASDDDNGSVYAHDSIGDPSPVITSRSPDRGAVDVPLDAVVQATFSKDMKAATFTPTTFSVQGDTGLVPGSRSYDSATRTETFAPDSLLKAGTAFTVTVTNGVQDTSNQPLFRTDTWSFTTVQPTVQFQLVDYSVNENVATATITVTLSSESSKPVMVDYAASDGTATAGSDFTAVSDTLTFAPGEISKTFDVTILDDGVEELNETVNLTLSNPTEATLGAQSASILTIVDDDGPSVIYFDPASYVVDESVGSVLITVKLSHDSTETVTVDYATSDGTAKAGDDYVAKNGSLIFSPHQLDATFSVTINNDLLDEADETINLTLSNPSSNATLGDPGNTATVTITDNDPIPAVHFSTNAYSVDEDAGTAMIAVVLSQPSGREVSIDYATSPGSAAPGVDYNSVSDTLIFAPGETNKAFQIPIINDGLDEPNKTVNLALSSPVNATLDTPKNAVLTIVDASPSPVVQFSSTTYIADETAGAATITVVLSTASGQTVAVEYATSDGTATAGDDYTAVGDVLVFLPGETSKTFDVPIKDDALPEGNETVLLTLSNADDAILGTAQATLTIADDESPEPLEIFLPLISRNN